MPPGFYSADKLTPDQLDGNASLVNRPEWNEYSMEMISLGLICNGFLAERKKDG